MSNMFLTCPVKPRQATPPATLSATYHETTTTEEIKIQEFSTSTQEDLSFSTTSTITTETTTLTSTFNMKGNNAILTKQLLFPPLQCLIS